MTRTISIARSARQGLCPRTPRIYRFAANRRDWEQTAGRRAAPLIRRLRTARALRLRPRRALSSRSVTNIKTRSLNPATSIQY